MAENQLYSLIEHSSSNSVPFAISNTGFSFIALVETFCSRYTTLVFFNVIKKVNKLDRNCDRAFQSNELLLPLHQDSTGMQQNQPSSDFSS